MDISVALRASLYAVALLAGVFVFTRVRSPRARQLFLLAVSYALYLTWGPWFLIVLLASTAVNHLLGRRMQRNPSTGILWAGLLFNLLLLAFFKYLPGVAVSVPLASLQRFSHLALPLGISFWTFQAMSYLLDLYRGEELDPSFVEFALYMAFFPVTISGPICRMPDMLPQFRSEAPPSRDVKARGLCRVATGLLMMQIAQLLGKGLIAGQGINAGFDQAHNWSGADVWLLALGYGLQIFFDFAGYSHIAIGAARMLGFTVPENFARPFASTTPSVFWTRWHMSLSFWIRDYVFLPLAMLRRAEWWRKFCLLVAMVLFGIWHRGTILFVLFGCYHGVLLILHRQTQQIERRFDWQPASKVWIFCSWALTMALLNLGWILFRAGSLAQAGQMFAALLSPPGYAHPLLHPSLYLLVATVGIAYALTLVGLDALDHYAGRLSASSASAAVAVRDRWVWLAPIWAVACILVLTLVPHQGRAANVFLYRFF
ncbi:MAG TPA: MBOAT family O-acyltransferase [Bryocella sp.]|nr:MBOAT family O-acyltransferase [Bryocella sp.]